MRDHLIRLLILLLTFLIAGCAQFAEHEKQLTPVPEPAPPLTTSRQDLERQITSLQERIGGDKLAVKDRAAARELLGIYRLLRDAAGLPLDRKAYRELIERIYEKATRLDSAFLPLEEKAPSPDVYAVTLFSKKQQDIVDTYLSGDHRGVINRVLALEKTFGSDALSPQVGLLYALSLAHEGLLEEAVDVGERVARDLEQRPGLIVLETRIAQWYSRLGQEDAAMLRYERLTDVMDDKMEMLGGLKKELAQSPGQRTQQPENSATEKGKIVIGETPDGPLQPLMKQVEEHIQSHDFDGARALLIQKRDSGISASESETIDQAMKSVDRAEDVFLGKRIVSLSPEEKAQKDIRRLMEDEKYDEVVSRIEKLKLEGIQSDDLKNLELEATEKLINRDRKRAAGLFLKAKKTESLVEKKNYLNMSRVLLENLLHNFPSSPLQEKIKRNLESVDEELQKL